MPAIWTRYLKLGGTFPEGIHYDSGYSLKLTPISRSGAAVTAKIHLSLPDHEHSFLIGTFVAKTQIPRLLNTGYEIKLSRGSSWWKSETPTKLIPGAPIHCELGPYILSMVLKELMEKRYELQLSLSEGAYPTIELMNQKVEGTAPAPLEFNASVGDVNIVGAVFLGEPSSAPAKH